MVERGLLQTEGRETGGGQRRERARVVEEGRIGRRDEGARGDAECHLRAVCHGAGESSGAREAAPSEALRLSWLCAEQRGLTCIDMQG